MKMIIMPMASKYRIGMRRAIVVSCEQVGALALVGNLLRDDVLMKN